MKAVVQRVRNAKVTVDGAVSGSIGLGLLVYLGVCDSDNEEICARMASKIARMRVFQDVDDKMNLSVSEVGGEVLVVSQFTLYASMKKGNRPSFEAAGRPDLAERLYEIFMEEIRKIGLHVEHGKFGAPMHVEYENDGPVTILMDSEELFS